MSQLTSARHQLRNAIRTVRVATKPIRRAVRPLQHYVLVTAAIMAGLICYSPNARGQASPVVLQGPELNRVVPSGFYFQGQSAPTQVRNSSVVRLGDRRFVVVGMVDTSGYSADIRAKYEGFFITDSAITINGTDLGVGAYGFGFGQGKFNILDLAGNEILSVSTTNDSGLLRPRPLMMTKVEDGIRLYSGKDYALIAFK